MSTAERKAREWQAREDLFVNVALKMIEANGFNALSLDKIATQSDYSRGTVYNHFDSREDVILELGLRALAEQAGWIRHAGQLPGRTRERLLAMHVAYQLFAQHRPVLYQCLSSARSAPVMARSSPERLARKAEAEAGMTALIEELIGEAVRQGDLGPAQPVAATMVAVATWALNTGMALWRQSPAGAATAGGLPGDDVLTLAVVGALLDGLGWNPLAGGRVDPELMQRIHAHLQPLLPPGPASAGAPTPPPGDA